jgi:hypothetical protein
MQIEIDFDVYKALTILRETEEVTVNDVLRKLLRLPEKRAVPAAHSDGCIFKGVRFPEGTQFRAVYKGKTYTGEIKNAQWQDSEGKLYTSPSSAAFAITQSGINGWWFWEAKRPSDPAWIRLGELRGFKAA